MHLTHLYIQTITHKCNHPYLVVSPRVTYDEETRLLEGLLDLVGEGARGELTSHRSGTNVVSKLQDATLQGPHSKQGQSHTVCGHALMMYIQQMFPVYACTCPTVLLDMTQMSAGFSMATMILAANSSFSQVFFRLKSGMPAVVQYQG